jgi:hypothetical protein
MRHRTLSAKHPEPLFPKIEAGNIRLKSWLLSEGSVTTMAGARTVVSGREFLQRPTAVPWNTVQSAPTEEISCHLPSGSRRTPP